MKISKRVKGLCTDNTSQCALLLLTASLVVAPHLAPQAIDFAPQGASVTPPAYEVVSVKTSKPCGGMSVSSPPGRFSARCVTLWGLIFNAYAVRPNDPIPGLPGWADSAQFDVEAKMGDDTIAALQKLAREHQAEQRNLMLQSLLADRFKLRIHHETIERPIYSLVVAKGGFKLRGARVGDVDRRIVWGSGRIDLRSGSIANLAFILSDVLGRAVVDKTEIAGKYDIALTWTPDELQGASDAGPSIFAAIQEQLGLKLESAKGPVDIIVVDHVEKPSEN